MAANHTIEVELLPELASSSRRTLIREIFEEDGVRMYTGIQNVLKDMSWRPRRHASTILAEYGNPDIMRFLSPFAEGKANLIVKKPCSKTCTSTLPTSGLFVDDMK
ncbi:unnamed protein product [Ectocarpus sp. 12 AP-2014]